MATPDSYPHGTFSWVDLMTPNPAGAKAFYTALFGWTAEDQPTDMGPPYTMFKKNGRAVAGMGPQPPDMKAAGAPPVWNSYVTVDDAAATAKAAEQAGGKVTLPVMQVMSAGHMAFIADPTGARLAIWQPGDHHGAGVVTEVNSFCWNELITDDVSAAKAFYERVFGWTHETREGPTGPYALIQNQGRMNGGVLAKPPEMAGVPNFWSVYFRVADIEAAMARCKELGGAVITDVMHVPGTGRFTVLADPDGGSFEVLEFEAA